MEICLHLDILNGPSELDSGALLEILNGPSERDTVLGYSIH